MLIQTSSRLCQILSSNQHTLSHLPLVLSDRVAYCSVPYTPATNRQVNKEFRRIAPVPPHTPVNPQAEYPGPLMVVSRFYVLKL